MKKFLPEIFLIFELIVAFIVFDYNALVGLFCLIITPLLYGKMLDLSERKIDRD